jgi:hypothetical protein
VAQQTAESLKRGSDAAPDDGLLLSFKPPFTRNALVISRIEASSSKTQRSETMWHDDGQSNNSQNPDFRSILLSRRKLLGHAITASVATLGMPLLSSHARGQNATSGLTALPAVPLDFQSVAMSNVDQVVVPNGYSAQIFLPWGEPLLDGAVAFKADASNTAAEQALAIGMHHDGMHFFPFENLSNPDSPEFVSNEGVLCINHEYTDDGLLHRDGMTTWSLEKVNKSKAAHGVSVVHVRKVGSRWESVRPSFLNRRITADTVMQLTGPAAGDSAMVTAADATGTVVRGTLNNCAHGQTPWGTYLTCEENFNGYFVNAGTVTADQRRLGISANGGGYRWHEFDERFDAAKHPNEANRFGWVVEIDPLDPQSTPKKRTSLGRFKHEGATVALADSGQVVVYMGDDERFEYIYKFVSKDRYVANSRARNFELLDQGTLYVAKFNADATGEWIALEFGRNGLTAANGFRNQADVLIRARAAADFVGATKMDRPEWAAVNPVTKQVLFTLTNNSQRGTAGRAAVDAANPRAANNYGQVIRFDEDKGDLAALRFKWDLLVLAGDPSQSDPAKRGNVKGDGFGSPDGLFCDPRGILWVQTDVSTSTLGQGDYVNLPNNQMLAYDAALGEFKRFMLGPKGAEVTGITFTPDGRNAFVNIQHPGESPSERSDPNNPSAISSFPSGGRPRSCTVVITRNDGKAIGSSVEMPKAAPRRRLTFV